MKKLIFIFFIFSPVIVWSQGRCIKIIPEIGLKFGSQHPTIGIEANLISGLLYKDVYFLGIGGGYTSNLGFGGPTYPLFIDGRVFFSGSDLLNFLGFNIEKELKMNVNIQTGMSINKHVPFKTGFLFSAGLAHRFDLIKIKSRSLLPVYAGINLEYNRTGFYDEYRGYVIGDGYISQLFLHLKLSLDFNEIKLNK